MFNFPLENEYFMGGKIDHLRPKRRQNTVFCTLRI